MKNRDFMKLAKILLAELPGFSMKMPLIFIAPITHTLRGLYFESHSYEANKFYIWVFFLPIFIPRKHVSFEFGKRLGRGPWNIDTSNLVSGLTEAVKSEALPFLSKIESFQDIVRAAMALELPNNPHIQEAIAYAWARSGDVARASEGLMQLVRLLDVKIPWQCEMAERAETLKEKLLADPLEAQGQLDIWEMETLQNLGLANFRKYIE